MPTRISGACNGCRSKKQKCSGDKNGCAQCEAAGIPCTWPEQRKRGPAKGYIEGLENRLHDAESLLLQLLPFVTTEQLHVATSALSSNNMDYDDAGRSSPDRRGSPPILNKKTGIEYWENFPLTTVTGIQRWQQDCEAHHGGSSSGNQLSTATKPDTRHSSPGSSQMQTTTATTAVDPSRRTRHSMIESTSSRNGYDENRQTLEIYKIPATSDMSAHQMMTGRNNSSSGNNAGMYTQAQQQHQHSDWQTSMMNMSNASSQMSHQLFAQQAGYLPNSWPQQQPHSMQMPTTTPAHAPHNTMSAESGQTHSHLFW